MTVFSGMVAFFRVVCFGAAVLLAGAGMGVAQQQMTGLARLEPARSTLVDGPKRGEIGLGISQPVPYRVFLLDDPPRLVADFREVDFGTSQPGDASGKGLVRQIRWGQFRPGWSRMVVELTGPVRIDSAGQETGEDPRIVIRFSPVTQQDFRPRAGEPSSALWDLPQPALEGEPHQRQDGSRPLRVVLDPGHGGIDPGAQAAGLDEAVLTLTFARELKEALTRAGIQTTLTRDENIFVPLETRTTIARAVTADLLISLHADAISEGEANGATIYLFEDADGAATRKLAERHDRSDLLTGVDLTGHDDGVAGVLMEMARSETQPRSMRFAQVLKGAIRNADLRMHPHAIQKADFSVLKSPDIPSVLLELGFMSSETDRKRLLDADWRQRMSTAVVKAVEAWARADAAEARLIRQ